MGEAPAVKPSALPGTMSNSIRNTKIVATLGPSSDSPDVIRKLIAAGVNVFRVNASHGTQPEHGARIQTVRALAKEAGVMIGILLDLQGPKIRLGKFEGGHALLETGARFTISTEECLGTAERASTVYAGFATDVKPGDRVLLADGSIELRALRSDGKAVECEVVSGGPISDRKTNRIGCSASRPVSIWWRSRSCAGAMTCCGCGISSKSTIHRSR
jgi:pyruvate kinase